MRLSLIIIIICIFYSCQKDEPLAIEKGVSKQLADYRVKNITDLKYELYFKIPLDIDDSIIGKENISFILNDVSQDLQIDFKDKPEFINWVKLDSGNCDYSIQNEHIIIPKNVLKTGTNNIEIEFIAGETSLNRNREFLYTLFVPDRARTAFPCFDQPNLKGTYELILEVPEEWEGMANGKLIEEKSNEDGKTLYFKETKPLPTYLFSFAAGKFEKITRSHNQFEVSVYHRETDTMKVANNIDSIYNLIFHSLHWLEEYTQIDYPFAKYDIIAIPSFQYGGMEHTGATLYRSSRIFLEESATQDQLLQRANLIAHETAHMWFGDFITMKWFDEVWLKEVFANFIADKIIKPQFPDVDYDLLFLMNHFPSAYQIDRTKGANPINQNLQNMKNAGTVYGAIIYHKAPIVMKKLERIIGEDNLREGLQQYLNDNPYGNADWNELITILDSKTEFDLISWSKVWVFEPGMPVIKADIQSENGRIKEFKLINYDKMEKGRVWNQDIRMSLNYKNTIKSIKTSINGNEIVVEKIKNEGLPDYLILNTDGLEYGYFEMDDKSIEILLSEVNNIKSPLTRGVVWLNLYENFLNNRIAPTLFLTSVNDALKIEQNDLIVSRILNYLNTIYWKFLKDEDRNKLAPLIENNLWELANNGNLKLKRAYFNTFESICITDEYVQKLYDLHQKKLNIPDLKLSENDRINMAFELAVRNSKDSDEILNFTLNNLENADNKEKMSFIMPALSGDKDIRNQFFESLKKPKNREHEPWVETAVYYLNHPLRSKDALHYIKPSLELLIEIQETGDIFFPLGWINNVLAGHNSKEANEIVQQFLNENPDYSEKLKLKILQANDLLERATLRFY